MIDVIHACSKVHRNRSSLGRVSKLANDGVFLWLCVAKSANLERAGARDHAGFYAHSCRFVYTDSSCLRCESVVRIMNSQS